MKRKCSSTAWVLALALYSNCKDMADSDSSENFEVSFDRNYTFYVNEQHYYLYLFDIKHLLSLLGENCVGILWRGCRVYSSKKGHVAEKMRFGNKRRTLVVCDSCGRRGRAWGRFTRGRPCIVPPASFASVQAVRVQFRHLFFW